MNGHYGRKYGRKMRQNKHRLMAELLPELEIKLEDDRLPSLESLTKGFDRINLEVGFGAGEHLALQAKEYPNELFIGCEPFINGIAALLQKVEQESLNNVRIFPDDAMLLLKALPENFFSKVFILFPDPWPKARHNKRRFVNKNNLAYLSKKMKEQAQLLLATDHDDYFEWMLKHIDQHPNFNFLSDTKEEWLKKPDLWTLTRFQEKANKAGRVSRFLRLVRK
tara:strand:- start:17389 stop:18057 length:669 start_codon:yes stop_codon:yes gene_type:complete